MGNAALQKFGQETKRKNEAIILWQYKACPNKQKTSIIIKCSKQISQILHIKLIKVWK